MLVINVSEKLTLEFGLQAYLQILFAGSAEVGLQCYPKQLGGVA
jgi:hypothetical protein